MMKSETLNLKPVTSQPLNLMDVLQKKDGVYPLSNTTVAYTPTDGLTSFLPLYVSEKDTEILVTLQDDVQDMDSNSKLSVFTDSIAKKAAYKFAKDDLLELIDEEPDLLFEITALMESWDGNELVTEKKLLKILSILKDSDLSIEHVLLVLSNATVDEINKLFVIAEDMPTHIYDYFIRVLGSHQGSADVNYDKVYEDYSRNGGANSRNLDYEDDDDDEDNEDDDDDDDDEY